MSTEIKRFTHKGLAFILSTEPDSDHGSPWDDGDGNGVVTGWTSNEREYVGAIVTLVDLPEASASLWGIEDYAGHYIENVANELAEQVMHELPAKLAQAQARIDALRVALGRII